jgi:hypothetical protein
MKADDRDSLALLNPYEVEGHPARDTVVPGLVDLDPTEGAELAPLLAGHLEQHVAELLTRYGGRGDLLLLDDQSPSSVVRTILAPACCVVIARVASSQA